MSIDPQADRARGAVVGVAAGLLTIAAHGIGGAGYPDLSSLTLLLAVCAAIGALAATAPARGAVTTLGLLGAGQVAGHYALSEMMMTGMGHAHGATSPSSVPMLLAHALATALCALLILAADRLYSVITNVLRIVAILFFRPVTTATPQVLPRRAARPLFGVPLRGAISRRGPPLPVF
ncbi:hypothetical protein [Antrihabitans cavernicola]|uniref:Uncharacterized protein n=1 Tax=Antrihabitans cavernicola TaxID=2495913 RepID=A0A5A7SK13_9NOCA|nr:hypothetical protein [Spelaeibacter cavernicola]KAA0024785.1 hypothetical protein FOY51_02300 [Spelaeibacter cavernicola]